MNLDLVTSKRKRNDIGRILKNHHPGHEDRRWLVQFLSFVGYTENEILDMIDMNNCWDDYGKDKTAYYVEGIVNWVEKANGKHAEGESFRSRRSVYYNHDLPKHAPWKNMTDVIKFFLVQTEPVVLNVPSNLSDAVAYYNYMGFTVLPKSRTGKKPFSHWKDYQYRKPTPEELMRWDFSNGICLLANEQYSFLDLDVLGYSYCFKGWHVEKTPRGGCHVFGKGMVRNCSFNGAEVKGIGALVVSAPTEGYEVLKW